MNKTATVTVSREGVQFGSGAWYSHEKITGVPLAVLQDTNTNLGIAASNYWNWLASALNGIDPPAPQPMTAQLEIAIDATMIDEIRAGLTADHRILFDIIAERVAQDKQWGGPEHDDAHRGVDWLRYINRQSTLACNETLSDDASEVVDPEGYRARMVKIAALAIAAIESHDRKHDAPAEADDFRSFGKDEFMDFLNEALPEQISVRRFSMEYWVGLGGGHTYREPIDNAVRRLNEDLPTVEQAAVRVDYSDASIEIEVSA